MARALGPAGVVGQHAYGADNWDGAYNANTLRLAVALSGVKDKDLTSPPVSPAQGDAYIVGGSATGAWASKDDSVVVYDDNGVTPAWLEITPWAGMTVYVADEDKTYRYNGGWAELAVPAALAELGVGAGAAPTAYNLFYLRAQGAMFDHPATGSGGVQGTFNKKTAGDDAGFVLQQGYSTRATFGLFGDNKTRLSVSPDAVAFHEAMVVDEATGEASFPNTRTRLDLPFRFRAYAYTDNRWVAPEANTASLNMTTNLGTGTDPTKSPNVLGIFVSAGSRLTGLSLAGKASDASITGFDVRVVFQHGDYDNTWDTIPETTAGIAHSADGVATSGTAVFRHKAAFGFDCPADGFVFLAIRPTGTLASTQYLYLTGVFSILSKAWAYS